MVLVEGIHMNAKRIRKTKLVNVWKTLSNKSLPKIKAFKLTDEDFNYVIDHRRCPADDIREIYEWGRTLSTNGTDACVFNADKNDDAEYVIIIRENPYHSLDEIIVHELSQIAKGDL